jgi:hypothetical protein
VTRGKVPAQKSVKRAFLGGDMRQSGEDMNQFAMLSPFC